MSGRLLSYVIPIIYHLPLAHSIAVPYLVSSRKGEMLSHQLQYLAKITSISRKIFILPFHLVALSLKRKALTLYSF